MARKKKDENEMTATVEEVNATENANGENTAVENTGLKIAGIKQQVTMLNLVTGDDEKIEISYSTYKVDEKVDPEITAETLSRIVSPLSEQNKALANYAQSQSYQLGKLAAMAKGSYLTQDIRSAIVDFLRMTGKFEGLKASEIFDRWLAGYKGGKDSAKKILERIQENADLASDL